MITYELKRKCVELANDGKSYAEIYKEHIKGNSGMSFRSFSRRMAEWKHKVVRDTETLDAANLAYKFAPHASTVQVNAKGEVIQAWIKQHTENRLEELLEALRDNTPVAQVYPIKHEQADGMLEIPLFDMHFGIANMEHYKDTLAEILAIIESKKWEKIIIPVGQDLFHNDSITKGVTTKGTPIERVNLKKAVYDAKTFYFNLIDTAIANANEVKVIYSPGNHDKTVGWLFVQILLERYGKEIVDDSLAERKAVWWRGCFIGITHGEKKTDTAQGLRGKFTIEFPALFATAKVREIHTGHLHRESSMDEYGVQVRRMSTGNKDDEWTITEGYKSQKRFMLFEWMPDKLRAIYYVN
jgi:UDP-2,3-diacylglucosamine pyrophosphatase LpxH